MLTGQFVFEQPELRHASAEAELRGDVACAPRRHFFVRGTLVYQSSKMSKKVLTGQLVVGQSELLQCRAEAEFRRDVACAARRYFLDCGTLVYEQHEHKKTYRSAGYPGARGGS